MWWAWMEPSGVGVRLPRSRTWTEAPRNSCRGVLSAQSPAFASVGVIVHRVPPHLSVGAAVGGVQQRPQRIRRRRLHRGQRLPRPPQQLPRQRRVVLPHVGQVRVDVRSVGVGVAPRAADIF